MNKKRACMINVFFGEIPHWWLSLSKTIWANPQIDFLVFGDGFTQTASCHNMFAIEMTKKDFEEWVCKAFELSSFELDPVRKICDFKTAYGQIFKDIIQENYEFWGHFDLDVMFGNISNFIPDEYYDKYDIISADQNRLCGPFNLYRLDHFKKAYNLHKNWRDILFNQPPVAFDEIGLTDAVKQYVNQDRVLYGIGANGLPMQNYGSPHLNPPLRMPATWHDGNLTIDEDSRETMMIHMGFKNEMAPTFVLQDDDLLADQIKTMHIDTRGITHAQGRP